LANNVSLLTLYWEIGGVLAKRHEEEGWGAAALPRLALLFAFQKNGVASVVWTLLQAPDVPR
jgi:hypothetical protein